MAVAHGVLLPLLSTYYAPGLLINPEELTQPSLSSGGPSSFAGVQMRTVTPKLSPAEGTEHLTLRSILSQDEVGETWSLCPRRWASAGVLGAFQRRLPPPRGEAGFGSDHSSLCQPQPEAKFPRFLGFVARQEGGERAAGRKPTGRGVGGSTGATQRFSGLNDSSQPSPFQEGKRPREGRGLLKVARARGWGGEDRHARAPGPGPSPTAAGLHPVLTLEPLLSDGEKMLIRLTCSGGTRWGRRRQEGVLSDLLLPPAAAASRVPAGL